MIYFGPFAVCVANQVEVVVRVRACDNSQPWDSRFGVEVPVEDRLNSRTSKTFPQIGQ